MRDVEGSTGVGGPSVGGPKCWRPKQSDLGSSPPSISTPGGGSKTTSAPSNSPGRSRAATRGRPPVQMPQAIFPSGGTHPFRSFPVLRSFTGVTLFRSGAEPLRRRHRRPHAPALPIRRSAGSRHLLLTDRAPRPGLRLPDSEAYAPEPVPRAPHRSSRSASEHSAGCEMPGQELFSLSPGLSADFFRGPQPARCCPRVVHNAVHIRARRGAVTTL